MFFSNSEMPYPIQTQKKLLEATIVFWLFRNPSRATAAELVAILARETAATILP